MATEAMRSSRAAVMCAACVPAMAVATLAVTPAVAASAIGVRKCQSRDLRYPFSAGGPKTFGVFRLRISGGRCATAHKIAKDWMTRFEANLRAGQVSPPKSVDGFNFANLPVRGAQAYRERGRRRTTTIWFDYVLPNG